MGNKRWSRNRLIADFQVQGALVVRIVLYWMLCLLAIGTFVFLIGLAARPIRPLDQQLNDLWSLFRPTALASLVLLPAVILDVLRLTNRFAGPVFRLRRAMRDLSEGKPVEEIRFRKGDFWKEFAVDFNGVATRLRSAQLTASTTGDRVQEAELAAVGQPLEFRL